MMKILSQDESSKSGYWWYSSLWWNFISRMNIHHVKFVIIQVLMGTNTLCSCKLSCIRYFHYYSGWVGGWWEKLRIKTNSAQLKLKLGLRSAITKRNKIKQKTNKQKIKITNIWKKTKYLIINHFEKNSSFQK